MFWFNFSDSVDMLKHAGAIIEVAESDDLHKKTLMLIKDAKLRKAMGANAANAIVNDGNIITRCTDLILEKLYAHPIKKA